MSFVRSDRCGRVVLCVAGALVVGCGDTVIDSTKAEGALQSNLENSLHHKVSSVYCPSEQKVEPNATFTCAVVFSNGKRADGDAEDPATRTPTSAWSTSAGRMK